MPRMLTERLFARSARTAGSPADSTPSSRWHHGPWWSNSYLLTPLLSILVFLVVMSLILWSLNRREQQQQEDTLYRNVAWAQQQIRLSMTGAQEQIQALNAALPALGLSKEEIQEIDHLASQIQNFNPAAYTNLVNQFEAQAHPVEQQSTPNAPANANTVASKETTANGGSSQV